MLTSRITLEKNCDFNKDAHNQLINTIEPIFFNLTFYELQGICLKLILKPFMVSPVPPAGRLLGGLTNCVVTLLLVTEHT